MGASDFEAGGDEKRSRERRGRRHSSVASAEARTTANRGPSQVPGVYRVSPPWRDELRLGGAELAQQVVGGAPQQCGKGCDWAPRCWFWISDGDWAGAWRAAIIDTLKSYSRHWAGRLIWL